MNASYYGPYRVVSISLIYSREHESKEMRPGEANASLSLVPDHGVSHWLSLGINFSLVRTPDYNEQEEEKKLDKDAIF